MREVIGLTGEGMTMDRKPRAKVLCVSCGQPVTVAVSSEPPVKCAECQKTETEQP